jgi:hypothetical protein
VRQWSVDEVGEGLLDHRVPAVGAVSVHRGQGRVGEEGVIPPDREQLGLAGPGGGPDAADDQAAGQRPAGAGGQRVRGLGDLGVGDPALALLVQTACG